jgi:hypothetical protein
MEQKTEVPGVYKVSDGVLINKDNTSLQAYKAQKRRLKKIDNIEEEISSLRKDMDEIKTLLRGLIK